MCSDHFPIRSFSVSTDHNYFFPSKHKDNIVLKSSVVLKAELTVTNLPTKEKGKEKYAIIINWIVSHLLL